MAMHASQIFLPVLSQVLLTIFMFVAMSIVKSKALKAGLVDAEKRALHPDAWPDNVLKFVNNISNQFENPVLFYALCLILWAMKAVDIYSLSIAWLFVLTRVLHAWVHTGSNYVPIRKKIFALGCLCLVVLTLLSFKAVISDLLV
jgi:hypothetical protein